MRPKNILTDTDQPSIIAANHIEKMIFTIKHILYEINRNMALITTKSPISTRLKSPKIKPITIRLNKKWKKVRIIAPNQESFTLEQQILR